MCIAYYTPAQKKYLAEQCSICKRCNYNSIQNGLVNILITIVSVVQGLQSFGGGMEYPTITVISPNE